MNVASWAAQIILCVVFFLYGFLKLTIPFDELPQSFPWTEEFSGIQIKLIAALEILGAVAILIPMWIPKFRPLVPLSAWGLGLVMVGSVILHVSRGEDFIINLVLMALAAVVVWGRRGLFRKQQKYN